MLTECPVPFRMALDRIPFWKKTPFLRLLLPLMGGIAIQWYVPFPEWLWWCCFTAGLVLFVIFFFIPVAGRFRLLWMSGLPGILIFLSLGALLTRYHDVRNQNDWFGNYYRPADKIVVTLDEPPVEKNRSFKANATVSCLLHNETGIPAQGKVILYFQKELPGRQLQDINYGSKIIIDKPLQEIKNSGNPGGFDYRRYSLFKGITHQVYLKAGDYRILNSSHKNFLNTFLLHTREKVIGIIRTFIPGEREQGLAEALLIGYKNDLDPGLVQSYTNTGVVHIIAISGMHLALVYWLLALLLKPLQRKKQIQWLRPVLIISGLWFFSLLAGAQASVVRSAVMFTCIVAGESLSRKTSVYNTLAVSAFILLCYDPFWLWDVGFQLSYAAVLSIVIFFPPVYNWFYIRNKTLDFIWKINAVSIAAQILTLPVSVFHFHQFPLYFLLTNFLAVPLSGVILLGEIFLCGLSFIPFIAELAGEILSRLIRIMNTYIESVESLPYSLWDGLQVSFIQTILLYLVIAGAACWLMLKSKAGFKLALSGLLLFLMIRSYSLVQTNNQQKIIVYNVPQHQAIDIVDGGTYRFDGDRELLQDAFLRNFHLKPSRILHRLDIDSKTNDTDGENKYFTFRSKKIMLIDTPVLFSRPSYRMPVDLLVISKNPRIDLPMLANSFDVKQVVFDGSVPLWKLNKWKRICDSLGIPSYAVNEKGAFVMDLR